MRVTFVQIVVTLIGLHACMSMSRVAAALWVLDAGLGKPTVGIVLSLYSVGALSCALWAGNLVERYGFHRPAGMATAAAMAGLTLVALRCTSRACGTQPRRTQRCHMSRPRIHSSAA